MNWANRLTILRIILAPVFISAVLYGKYGLALAVFLFAAVTDGLDGYIARSRDQKTVLGTILDPIADKLLIGSAYISFCIVSGVPEYLRLPAYVPIIVISRDVFILLGAVIIYMLKGGIDVKPSYLGKVTTVFQMLTVIALLLRFVHSSWLWNFTTFLTLVSGLDYLRTGSKQINDKLH
ncbi:MAG: CDP-diacylglycerol--glycerol-3-phosphate 3-phosphatidyltransferase [Candidatus Omnitrophica bacterium]|nr:CDP-diacylglycerol--glycerol-3-phosphate 3-phosphatidyltransferase [Candidatus Omnitrophota bacterium]